MTKEKTQFRGRRRENILVVTDLNTEWTYELLLMG